MFRFRFSTSQIKCYADSAGAMLLHCSVDSFVAAVYSLQLNGVGQQRHLQGAQSHLGSYSLDTAAAVALRLFTTSVLLLR